jgi:hypothetical protein
MKKSIISITAFFSILLLAYAGSAQKLPKTQTQSVLLPSAFKIDGSAAEWNNKFQCFNKNVTLYCTIANDNNYLYLVVQATDPVIIKKLIAGGIKFTVCKSGERSEQHPFVATFPTIAFGYQVNLYREINEFKRSDKKDSLIKDLNKNLLKAIKLIKIEGGTAMADSISIYNQVGVKSAIHIDESLRLTCEILLPLKLVGIRSLANRIAYNIMLNGSSETSNSVKAGNNVTITDVPMGMSDDNSFQVLNFPTDFWGVCTLAKP